MAFLEVKNLQKRFGNTEVLKGIDFSLEKGDVLVIIGSSGSGKTTLLRCLNFLETPSGGSIAVDGQTLLDANDADTLSDKEIRKNRLHFGLVFQQFNLFPQYKVMDNLTLAPKLALHEQVKAAKKAGQNAKAFKQAQEQALEQNAKSLLERVGLADKADAYPCQLSGGQQQRVAIARALAADERKGVKAALKSAARRLAAEDAEAARLNGMYSFQAKLAGGGIAVGLDEVGRGPVAGPLAIGAVVLPDDPRVEGVNDSKQLSAEKREQLYDVILEHAVAVGIGIVSPQRIDEINILQATYEAMRQAIEKLNPQPAVLLNDAVRIPQVAIQQVPIIKGDAKSVSIAAASIVAKVTRDRMMEQYEEVFPGYGFARNKGYGSKEHIEALQIMGPTAIHRRSFIGHFVKEG